MVETAMRFDDLVDWFARRGPSAVLFSGGVDSTLAALAARRALGEAALAVTVVSPFMARFALARAEAVARGAGLRHRVITVDLETLTQAAMNDKMRCYHCKKIVVDHAKSVAGDRLLADGTNADDDPARPGRVALAEGGVGSPLAELRLGKNAVRTLARAQGLSNWGAPADSCLATRIPEGRAITEERLARVEALEDYLRQEGIIGVRVRDNDPVVTAEIPCPAGDPGERVRAGFTRRATGLGFMEILFGERRYAL